jgi:hypothetical protein
MRTWKNSDFVKFYIDTVIRIVKHYYLKFLCLSILANSVNSSCWMVICHHKSVLFRHKKSSKSLGRPLFSLIKSQLSTNLYNNRNSFYKFSEYWLLNILCMCIDDPIKLLVLQLLCEEIVVIITTNDLDYLIVCMPVSKFF